MRAPGRISRLSLAAALLLGETASYAADWFMAGANPQRTSWVSDQVDGALEVEWYRPIEAYIDQKVQLIVVGDRVLAASSKGLYALDARDGSLLWRYDTEMPLGHSPTVANDVAYVGSHDGRIHAVSATSGQRIWVSPRAGAGFAVNPVVANGLVYAGNRDGRFYAYSVGSGAKMWQFPPDNEEPLGPISYSAAHDAATNTLYFASDDNYAYALNASNGFLAWKSQSRMAGERFRSWWPVIQGDRVVFSGSRPEYAEGPFQDAVEEVYAQRADGYPGPRFTAGGADDGRGIDWLWADGTTVMELSSGYTNFPDLVASNPRLFKIQTHFNRTTGQEITNPVAPLLYSGKNRHNVHPPVLMPDGVLYQTGQAYRGGAGITRAMAMGWHPGSRYVSLAGADTAQDEPQYLSGGGNRLYRNLCCARIGDSVLVSPPRSAQRVYWTYSDLLDNQLPGYKTDTWFVESGFLDGLRGFYYGRRHSPNGLYHTHGDQNPLIPHFTSDGVGRIYVHRNNAVICYGPAGGARALPLVQITPTVDETLTPPSVADVRARLEREVAKIVNAGGYLKPGGYNTGQNLIAQLNELFYNPGDTLMSLLRAYPHLSSGWQTQLRTYLQGYFDYYFGTTLYADIGWQEPVQRNWMDFAPEFWDTSQGQRPRRTNLGGMGWSWQYPQNNIYAWWKYAQLLPGSAASAYNKARSVVETPLLSDSFGTGTYQSYFVENPFALHGYIAGYIGFLALSDLAGRPASDAALRARVEIRLNEFLAHRRATFAKDSPYTDPNTYLPVPGFNSHKRSLNLARNFMLLVPEIGDDLRQNIRPLIEQTVDEYAYVGPYWFVAGYEAGHQENTAAQMPDREALFQAKALILRQSYAELTKYLDAPAFAVGDLYYINNLAAALEAAAVPPSTDADPPSRPRRLRKRGL